MTERGVVKKQDIGEILSDYVVNTTYPDLPSETVEMAKMATLDTLAVMLAASRLTPGIKEIVEMAKEAGGREESTIIGFGGKVPAMAAAFANGSMAHALDYDDFHPAATHPSGPVLVSALALCEKLGRVSGKDFLTAFVVGTDIDCRLCDGISVGWKHDWYPAGVVGTFAATAAAAKVLGLTRQQLLHAFGFALQQAGMTCQVTVGMGSNLRGLSQAFPAEAGVRSALMAQRGIPAPPDAFEGECGLLTVHFGGEYDRDRIVGDLGKRFEELNACFKPWPACGQTLPFLDGTLQLMSEQHIAPDNVAEITIVGGSLSQMLSEPPDERRRPRMPMDARCSVPFVVAAAASTGKINLATFTEEGLADPASLAMAKNVTFRFDPAFDTSASVTPGKVVIRTKDGRSSSITIEHPRGFPKNPLSWGDLIEKFRDCAKHSVVPLSDEQVDRTIALARGLDSLSDVAELVKPLVPATKC